MRRWTSPVIILAVLSLLMAASPIVLTEAVINGVPTPLLLLTRVAPSTPLEIVTIQNVSNLTVDAIGWTIDDGEGWLKVNTSIILLPDDRLSFSLDGSLFNSYYPDEKAIAYKDGRAQRHGTFALSDKGDQVDLIDPGGRVMDSFCYGAAVPSSGWSGMPYAPLKKGDMAVREADHHDTNTSTDWRSSCIGRSELGFMSHLASVDPFTSPEGAQNRMIREIIDSQATIDACVYDLKDQSVVEAFAQAQARGVEVTLLIEGQPVAGLANASKTAIVKLVQAGCDVRLMTSNLTYRRYDCLHAKYLVVDKARVTVMSENWAGGLISNRGWGVTVASDELAADVTSMFREDSSLERRDVREASEMVMDWYAPPGNVELPPLKGRTTDPVMADVSLIISPDTSYRGMIDLIASATTRILVEQLYIDPAWVEKNLIMNELIDAADRGVQVRVLMDETFVSTSDTRNNSMTVDALNSLARERGIDLEARLVSAYHDFGVMHNKGVIVDSKVLVSSINWVDVSVFQNREVGLVISSLAVSSFFADCFWQDWAIDPGPPRISLPWNNLTLILGQPVILDARESRDNAGIVSYQWRDSLTGVTWNGSYVMTYLGLGIHDIILKVADRFENIATTRILVIINPPDAAEEPNYLIFIPAGGGVLACVLWIALRKIKNR